MQTSISQCTFIPFPISTNDQWSRLQSTPKGKEVHVTKRPPSSSTWGAACGTAQPASGSTHPPPSVPWAVIPPLPLLDPFNSQQSRPFSTPKIFVTQKCPLKGSLSSRTTWPGHVWQTPRGVCAQQTYPLPHPSRGLAMGIEHTLYPPSGA